MRFDCDGRWERFSLLNTCHQKCGNGRGHKLSVLAGFPSHSTDALQLLSRIPIPPSRTGNAVLSDQPYLDMSKTTLTPPNSPSSDLQAVFEASLTEYEKKTGTSLLTHPLMDQLRACDSSIFPRYWFHVMGLLPQASCLKKTRNQELGARGQEE